MLSLTSLPEIYQVARHDPAYPARLREMRNPPAVLYGRGMLRPQDDDAVAIVGTRKPGIAAAKLTFALSYELAERGFTIVSGLALGIDTQAHRGALQARLGRTVAVLGAGLNTIHPKSNAALARQISQRGALLSEHPADTSLAAQQLVARDRLISGLSRALIVMETALDGGAMYAAEFARQQNRLLLALPGSPGCDALIAHGALPLDPASLDLDYLALQIRTHTIPQAPTQMTLL
jgi:DNA processing protein